MSDGGFSSDLPAGIWHSLNRFVVILIVLTIAVPIAYSFLPEVKKRKDQAARVEELKAEIERERMLLARNEREVKLLMHDPEYVGTIARDRLGLMREGETIYRLDPPKPKPEQMRRNP